MTLLEKSTPGRRRALLALAAAKRRNKRRMAEGLKPIVEGKKVSPDSLSKHYGPGAHPGTGTDQTVHDPGTGGGIGGDGEGGGAFDEGGVLGGGEVGGTPDFVEGDMFNMDAAPPPSNVPADMAEPETNLDQTIRPQTLDDFVGQDNLKDQLGIMIDSARQRNAPLDHTLFTGPPGLGKTTLANIVGNELGADVKVVTAGAIRNRQDVAALVLGLEDGDILFIDEIHGLDETTAELLYPAMEDFEIDVPIGDEVMRMETPKFTLIGATTRAGSLPAPLRSRFGGIGQLDLYQPQELSGIVDRTAGLLELNLDPEASLAIASRARGTPRIANKLTEFMRDYSLSRGVDTITAADVDAAFAIRGVDGGGLTRTDRKYLSLLSQSSSPVGVGTIAAYVGEESTTIEDAWEPFLLREGYIMRTPRGRLITERGLAHLEQYGIEKRFYKAITNTDPMRCLVVNCLKDHLRAPGEPQEPQEEEPEEEEEPVAKHGEHNQKDHGNWARGTSARQMLADATSSGEPRSGNRGLTRYMPTGSEPSSGVGVGMSERTQWFPSEPSRRQIRDYVRANADLLNQTNGQYHIGFWESPDGRWSLDVSQVFPSPEEAFKAYPKEEAVFDYSDFETIYNPGL